MNYLDTLIKEAGPSGKIRFNGNPKPLFGDLNKVFTKDQVYDLYIFEGQGLAYGSDGNAYKVTGDVIWTDIQEETLDKAWEEVWLAIAGIISNCNPEDPHIIRLQNAAYDYQNLENNGN